MSLAERRCDRIAFATFAASAAGGACCERVGLLNAALCFCDSKLASLVGQRRERLARTFVAAPMACGFAVYARIDETSGARPVTSSGPTAGRAGEGRTARARQPGTGGVPSRAFPRIAAFAAFAAVSAATAASVASARADVADVAAAKAPAPSAPSGPRGPPGPPGRGAAWLRAPGWFVSRASCPPWVRACRGDERGWEYLGTRWKGEDDVFSWKPRAPPGLESVGR